MTKVHDQSSEGVTASKSDEQRKRRRVLGWLGRADKGYDLYQLLSGFAQSKAGVATVSLGIAAAVIGGVATIQPDLVRLWMPGGDVEVATERWGDSSVVYPIEGVDNAGRRARFDVVLLTKQYTWLWGSDTALAKETRALTQVEVLDTVLTGRLRSGLSRSPEVIAVGVASEEGTSSVESTRAQRRALTSAHWLKQILPASTRINRLNLGQYKSTCGTREGGDSSWQRPFVMIGVREQAPGINLSEALANALTGKSNMPGPACYSQFEMTRQG